MDWVEDFFRRVFVEVRHMKVIAVDSVQVMNDLGATYTSLVVTNNKLVDLPSDATSCGDYTHCDSSGNHYMELQLN